MFSLATVSGRRAGRHSGQKAGPNVSDQMAAATATQRPPSSDKRRSAGDAEQQDDAAEPREERLDQRGSAADVGQEAVPEDQCADEECQHADGDAAGPGGMLWRSTPDDYSVLLW